MKGYHTAGIFVAVFVGAGTFFRGRMCGLIVIDTVQSACSGPSQGFGGGLGGSLLQAFPTLHIQCGEPHGEFGGGLEGEAFFKPSPSSTFSVVSHQRLATVIMQGGLEGEAFSRPSLPSTFGVVSHQ